MVRFFGVIQLLALCSIAMSESDCWNFETEDQYEYHWNLERIADDVTRIEFSARASNDVHIGLSSKHGDADQMYEIVIGGWQNTRSAIRRCKQCENLAFTAERPSGFLNSDEFRKFWIEFLDGNIAVGYIGEDAFMQYQDPSPINVNFVGYSTGWGSSGSFKFCDYGCWTFETDDQYKYRYNLPRISDDVTHFEFAARASNDVHIGMSPKSGDADQMYEIVIGGWQNTRSAIRRCKQCENLALTDERTPGFLNPDEFRKFWIELLGGNITIGYDGEPAFMKYQDPSPIDVNYVGYSTGWGSSGSFKFCDIFGCRSFVTDDQYKYRYNLPRIPDDVNGFSFSAKASNDVHIGLSPKHEDADQMYEIAIGGWQNTRSAIRLCKQCESAFAIERTSGFLNPDEFRNFWVEWLDGIIEVGYIGEPAFMKYQDSSPIDVNYVGYSTGWGSSGNFKFCNIGCWDFDTDAEYTYRYNLPRIHEDVNRFEFSVKASNDAFISLSSKNEDADAMYEIVIGGWSNKRSAIRRCKWCNSLVLTDERQSGFLSPDEFRDFWIEFSNGNIAVGYVGEPAFMDYHDEDPLDVNYVGYCTGWGSSGSFSFCEFGV